MRSVRTRLLVLLLISTVLLLVYAVRDDWGRPLGADYAGPEGRPRPVAQEPVAFSADERATIAVFEKAAVGYRDGVRQTHDRFRHDHRG